MSRATPGGLLTCPVCHQRLEQASGVWRCAAGHSFDEAREGYVNLLTPQQTARNITGDSVQMLHARRSFHERGHFLPLRQALGRVVAETLGGRYERMPLGPAVVLEVGCGEGYYVGGISEEPADAVAGCGDVRWLGTDLSKHAVRLAAKRYPAVGFFACDVRDHICLAEGSVAVLLDVFAPRNAAEFARVLEPGGSAVIVIPGPAHVEELRATAGLIGVEPDKEARVMERFAGVLELAERTVLDFVLDLSADDARLLIEMGPNAHHVHGEVPGTRIRTHASVILMRFEKSADASAREETP